VLHGSTSVHDLPLGRYESECGPITVLDRIDGKMLHFRVQLHEGTAPQQENNEFMNIYIRPNGVVLASPDTHANVTYMAPDTALAREVCGQWLLCDVPVLREHATQILQWLDAVTPRAPW